MIETTNAERKKIVEVLQEYLDEEEKWFAKWVARYEDNKETIDSLRLKVEYLEDCRDSVDGALCSYARIDLLRDIALRYKKR